MDAFEKGLGYFYSRLKAYAMSLTHNYARAEDLTQETMLKALTNRDKFAMGSNLHAWLTTILKNRFLGEYRRAKTERAYLDVKELFAREEMDPGQEAAMEQVEVMEAIERLPREQRDALRLIAIEGHSYDSAAHITGSAVGTMKSRVSRSRIALIERLENDRSPQAARIIVSRHRKGTLLTLYGERFQLSETLIVAQSDLRRSTIKIFRQT